MRNLITKYTFIPGSHTITLPDFANLAESNPFGVENIRLIVNETQKVVICSSMQKDNVTVEGNTITYTEALAPLNYDDQLTIEVDMGDGILTYGGKDWVIKAKQDAFENGVDAQDLIITHELGKQLKPLAEVEGDTSIAAYVMAGAFANCATTKADLSSWERISSYFACYVMFIRNTRLREVDLSELRSINGEHAASNMFSSCPSLQSVDLSSLQTIIGTNAANQMFSNCTSLREISMPNLVNISGGVAAFSYAFQNCTSLRKASFPKLHTIGGTLSTYYPNTMYNVFNNCTSLKELDLSSLENAYGAGCIGHMCDGCSSLESVDLRSLIFWQTSDGNGLVFQKCPSLTTVKINCKVLKASSNSSNILSNVTTLTDLYLYGEPTNDIYLSWQGSLNFNSVCGVLRKLCENTDASGLVCSFKSAFNIDDKTEWTYTDGDGNTEVISNPNGILKGLREQATAQGWTIQNLTING